MTRLQTIFFFLLLLALGCGTYVDFELAYPWVSGETRLLAAKDWTPKGEWSYSTDTNLQAERFYFRFPGQGLDSVRLSLNDSPLVSIPKDFYAMTTVELTDSTLGGLNRLSWESDSEPSPPPYAQWFTSGKICITRTVSSGADFSFKTLRAGADWTTFRSSVSLDNATDTVAQILISGRLIDPDGRSVSTARSYLELQPGMKQPFELNFNTLYHPKLWSPENPVLYRYQISLWKAGRQCIDCISGDIGLRWVTFSARDGFQINGVPTRLRGTVWNPSADPEQNTDDLSAIRYAGANAVYFPTPPNLFQLMLCDRIGMFALCGLPLDLSESEIGRIKDNVKALQKQYGNHPSAVLIGCGEEPDERRTRQINTEDLMAASEVLTHDPARERNLMAVIKNSSTLMRLADVALYSMKDPSSNAFDELKKMEQDGVEVPVIPMISIPPSPSSALRGATLFDSMNSLPNWLNGCIYNTFSDSSPNGGGWVSVDRKLFYDDFYLVCSRWGSRPMVRISRYIRPDMIRSEIGFVRLFSNLPHAELFVNGISQGEAQAPFGEWKITLQPGENKITVKADSPEGALAEDEWILTR